MKAALEAPKIDDAFRVDEHELFTCKIVGIVESTDESSTNFVCRVNDGTGLIDCKSFSDKSSDAYQMCKRLT